MKGPCKTRLLLGQDLRADSVGSLVTAGRRDIIKGGLSLVLRALAEERSQSPKRPGVGRDKGGSQVECQTGPCFVGVAASRLHSLFYTQPQLKFI